MSSLHPSVNNWVVTAKNVYAKRVQLLAEEVKEEKRFITVVRLELLSDFIFSVVSFCF